MPQNGIGTLGERTLHAALKNYLQPDKEKQEVPYKGYIADIKDGNRITEIQTRNFYALKDKLEVFLEENDVTVVYPITRYKWLLWMDPGTGATTKKRKSTKIGVPQELFYELYSLRTLIPHPRLHFLVCMVDTEEYRNLDGWSRDRKRGSTRAERIPVAFGNFIPLNSPENFAVLLPQSIVEPFTAKDFSAACHITQRYTSRGLLLLTKLGLIERAGKQGRAFLYRKASSTTPGIFS